MWFCVLMYFGVSYSVEEFDEMVCTLQYDVQEKKDKAVTLEKELKNAKVGL